MNRDVLERLSKDELIALMLAHDAALTAQIAALSKRVGELEANLGRPPKTPDNSSLPPSQGRKTNRAERRAAKRRKGHPGTFRTLADKPDRIVEALAAACPHCSYALGAADQPGFHAYDHVDLPPIRPVVTRVHRHRGTCPCCRRTFSAAAPAGLALRARPGGFDPSPACDPGDRLRAAGAIDGRGVRPHHQRGRHRQPARPC